MNSKIIIFKNDAVGDLTQSLAAIYNIIDNNKDKSILIYLSERSKSFSFLIKKSNNVVFRNLKYNLTLFEKIKIFFYILLNDISKIYILTPKSFYFFLPLIFKKIKFYGLCINGPNKYKRPNEFLRKKLFKYVVNDRAAIFKRDSIVNIQNDLVNDTKKKINEFKFNINVKKSYILNKYLPANYAYFHIKKSTIDKLNWNINDLHNLFNKLLKYYSYVVFSKDIEKDLISESFKEKFNVVDFSSGKFTNNNSNIFFFDNIKGEDLYYTIKNSSKTIAFHGMMTNLASLEKKPVLDLWYCNMINWDTYRSCRNAFYEFKPSYDEYNFIMPSKNFLKTVKKIEYSLNRK